MKYLFNREAQREQQNSVPKKPLGAEFSSVSMRKWSLWTGI